MSDFLLNPYSFSSMPYGKLIPQMSAMSGTTGTITAGVTTTATYSGSLKVNYPYYLTWFISDTDTTVPWAVTRLSFTEHASNTLAMAWWQFTFNTNVKIKELYLDESRYIDTSGSNVPWNYDIYISTDGTNFTKHGTLGISATQYYNGGTQYVWGKKDNKYDFVTPTTIKAVKIVGLTTTSNSWPSDHFFMAKNLRIYGYANTVF